MNLPIMKHKSVNGFQLHLLVGLNPFDQSAKEAKKRRLIQTFLDLFR